MKSAIKNELWQKDVELFARMKDNYQSIEERKFFEELMEREQWDFCVEGDLLLFEGDNDEELYMVRIYHDEYEIGRGGNCAAERQHTQNLSDALNLNLVKCGFATEDITLWEWLRRKNYDCIRYDRNHDYE